MTTATSQAKKRTTGATRGPAWTEEEEGALINAHGSSDKPARWDVIRAAFVKLGGNAGRSEGALQQAFSRIKTPPKKTPKKSIAPVVIRPPEVTFPRLSSVVGYVRKGLELGLLSHEDGLRMVFAALDECGL